MSRLNKWILIVPIVCLVSVIALVAYDLGYGTIRIIRDLRRMDTQRPVLLLYETDHRALLEACRKLSRQVAAGELNITQYRYYNMRGDPDPETSLFPQPILDLAPFQVYIVKDGQVDLIMSPVVMYGARAYPESFKGSHHGDIELVPSLWYFDEDFKAHPEHKKEVEELLKKRKAGDSSGVP